MIPGNYDIYIESSIKYYIYYYFIISHRCTSVNRILGSIIICSFGWLR
jgi:hypothetical protein